MGNFLNGLIGVYASDQCDAAGSTTQQIGADGYVYTTGGQAMAVAICNAAHTDRAYTAQQQAFNTDVWACQKVEPTATDTAIPPTSTNTVVPPTATNTAIPATLADTRAIGSVRVTGSAPGELSVSWDAPRETVRDYRLRWTKVGENYPAWSDLNFNAYPAASAYTIVGLEAGERYKVHVRARFAQGSGPWAREVQAEVMASVPATETTTNTPTITATDVPTDTAIAPPDTEVPPPNTATFTATSTPTNTATSTPTNTATDMPTNTATSTPQIRLSRRRIPRSPRLVRGRSPQSGWTVTPAAHSMCAGARRRIRRWITASVGPEMARTIRLGVIRTVMDTRWQIPTPSPA